MSWKANLEISRQSAKYSIWTLTCLYLFILTPISLYYARTFWQLNQQNIAFITNRHAKVVIFSVICWIIYPTVIRSTVDLIQLEFHYNTHNQHKWPFLLLLLVQSFQILIALICIRLWLLYYDYSHGVHTLNQKWKTQISKSDGITSVYWSIKYKWLGNVKIIMSIGISVACLFIFIIDISGNQYTKLLAVSWIIMIIIMIFQINKCRDEFCLQKEFLTLMWFMCVSTIGYIGLIMLLPSDSNISVVITNLCAAFACYCICLISTYWVIQQYFKQSSANIAEQTSQYLQNDLRRLTLEEILSSKHGFDLFANHLVKEFSIENLAFLFEVMQVKNEAITNELVTRDVVGFIVPITADRLNKVRRRNSNIYGVHDLKNNIRYIMEQYMYYGSEYSVNVSSFVRMTALNDYDQLGIRSLNNENDGDSSPSTSDVENPLQSANAVEYVTIFDKSLVEIVGLLKLDSLSRFYRSKEYKMMHMTQEN